MPQTTQQLPSEMAPDIEMVEEIKVTPRSASTSKLQNLNRTESAAKADVVESAKPGTSRPKSCMKIRTLTFHINYLDNVYKINLSELSTLSKCGLLNICTINDHLMSKRDKLQKHIFL